MTALCQDLLLEVLTRGLGFDGGEPIVSSLRISVAGPELDLSG